MPGQEASARLIDTDMPVISSGQALARLLQLGIDGTDIEIDRGKYGELRQIRSSSVPIQVTSPRQTALRQ